MKRLIAMLLAVITVFAALSGVTLAADSTVEVKLRPGRTVDVSTPAEFEKAYKAMYEADSDINRIRLMADMNLRTNGLRTTGGSDPWMSGFEKQLCVRMPEGTCLDLNGCTAQIRASNGLDDNGTGTPSGNTSFGTVIDTLGGGMLNLYCINEIRYMQHAIDLANANPEYVGIITVSQAMTGAESYEFTIPAGVTLRFAGKPAHLPAKKVTMQPGATVLQTDPASPALQGCGTVVWQYVDEADMNRQGSEFATEKEKVEGTVPVRNFVNYKITVEGGDSTVAETESVRVVPEPAVIKTSADATDEAAVITSPSEIKFWEPRKLTTQEIQKLIQDICVMYYYQSNEEPHIQYDGRDISKLTRIQRKGDKGRPEDAWFDSVVYSVCSTYCWNAYYTAFHMDTLCGTTGPRTRTWADLPTDAAKHPGLAYQYSGPNAENSKGETDLQKALTESRKIAQPGDIICYAASNGANGHALMYVGPIFREFGDNTDYILHCKGSSFDANTFQEKREDPGQAIELMKADETVWGGESASWSLAKADRVAMGFVLMRPSDDPTLPLPTQESMCRLQFPRMKITRELDRYKYDPAQAGEDVPVYLTIENKGSKVLTEVPVEEYIPEGTTLVEGSVTKGAVIDGSTIRWSVKIPAGKSITLTYKVKLSGKPGDVIDFKGGLVGGIASRTTSLQLGGVTLTEAQQTAIHDYAMSLRGKDNKFRDLNFFNKFYANSLGADIGLPKTTQELLKRLTHVKDGAVYRTGTDELDKMILSQHFTGLYADISIGLWARVRDYKNEYYQPGDIFIGLTGDSTTSLLSTEDLELAMYLGQSHMLHHGQDGTTVKNSSSFMDYATKYNVLICLRPTAAYEDLNARAAKIMAFTDVPANAWYYDHVEEMFQSGIINGMTETTFAPKGNLTWGQALKLVCLAVGESEQAAGSHWASGYLSLAKNKGWLSKDVDLNANITRKEFCQVAAKAKNLTEMPKANPFTDTASKEVMALYHAGVINGMTETTFEPDALLTRAQISKIISLLMKV